MKELTPKEQKQIDRLSPLAKYAYGFTDKKPGWTYWLVLAIVIIGAAGVFMGWWGNR